MSPEPSRHNREGFAVPVYAAKLLVLVAVIVFALVVFGVTIGSLTPLELLAAGLGFLAASFLIP